MLDAFLGHYAYWGAIGLLGIGLYTVSASANLVKKVMGLSIFQSAVFVFYIAIGAVEGGTAPIVDGSVDAAHAVYANPLPHVLILTAIVVGVATAALALALVVRIHAACATVEEDEVAAAIHALESPWAGIEGGGAGGGGGDGDVAGARREGREGREGRGP